MLHNEVTHSFLRQMLHNHNSVWSLVTMKRLHINTVLVSIIKWTNYFWLKLVVTVLTFAKNYHLQFTLAVSGKIKFSALFHYNATRYNIAKYTQCGRKIQNQAFV